MRFAKVLGVSLTFFALGVVAEVPAEIAPWWKELESFPATTAPAPKEIQSQTDVPKTIEAWAGQFRKFMEPIVLDFVESAKITDKYGYFRRGNDPTGRQDTTTPITPTEKVIKGFPVDKTEYFRDLDEYNKIQNRLIISGDHEDRYFKQKLESQIELLDKIIRHCSDKGFTAAGPGDTTGEEWANKARRVITGLRTFVHQHRLWAPEIFLWNLRDDQIRGEILKQMGGPRSRDKKNTDNDWKVWLSKMLLKTKKQVARGDKKAERELQYQVDIVRRFVQLLKQGVKGSRSLQELAEDERYKKLKKFEEGLIVEWLPAPESPLPFIIEKTSVTTKAPKNPYVITKLLNAGLLQSQLHPDPQTAAKIGNPAKIQQQLQQNRASLAE